VLQWIGLRGKFVQAALSKEVRKDEEEEEEEGGEEDEDRDGEVS
jgi:hypothetical protein